MRRMEIADGGDCGGEASYRGAELRSNAMSCTVGAAPNPATLAATMTCELLVGTPLKCPRTGRSLWQQPCETGIAAFPHSAVICLQQAISARVILAPGREQAIAGATSGRHTAKIKANWRMAFILCCHFDSTSILLQSAVIADSSQPTRLAPGACMATHVKSGGPAMLYKLGMFDLQSFRDVQEKCVAKDHPVSSAGRNGHHAFRAALWGVRHPCFARHTAVLRRSGIRRCRCKRASVL